MKKILIFVTNHATLGDTDQANGTYLPELTHALQVISAAGFDYDIASIKGGSAPIYGDDIDDAINTHWLANEVFMSRINNSLAVSSLNADDYDGVFYPGGFGLLSDLVDNQQIAAVTAAIYQRGKPVSAVCHGPAALLPITLDDGSSILAGKTVTAFTREEEIDYGTLADIPLLIEEALTRKAGAYHKVSPWGVNVQIDGLLITGQNPSSAGAVATALVEAL